RDSLALALLAIEIARLLPRVSHGLRAARGAARAAHRRATEPVHQPDEGERRATDQEQTDAGEADEKRSDRRKQRTRDLAEQFTDRARREVSLKRRRPRPTDLHERRSEDRHQQ